MTIKGLSSFVLSFMISFWLCARTLEAADMTPFATQNQNPLVSIYGLPAPEKAGVSGDREATLRLALDLSSHYVRNNGSSEFLVLDGETLRLTASVRYGIGHDMELGVDIPFLISGGGFLDSSIESYHKTFGFPNGGREMAPKNRLLFHYERNGVTLLNLEPSGQGPGDARITAAWQLYRNDNDRQKLALRGSLKLPTGEVGHLRGSGSTDLALWISGSLEHPFSAGRLSLFAAAGGLGMTRGRVLADQQRPLAAFGTLALGFAPIDRLELKIQANAHTSFYAGSSLKEVDSPSAQLTIGGAFHFTQKTSLNIGVTEDIVVGTSPDVVFHLALAHGF